MANLGFSAIGEKVDRVRFGHGLARGGWLYRCDGMPTQRGCGEETVASRRFERIGRKSTGWLVIYELNFDGSENREVVLTFCPSCAEIVLRQTEGGRDGD